MSPSISVRSLLRVLRALVRLTLVLGLAFGYGPRGFAQTGGADLRIVRVTAPAYVQVETSLVYVITVDNMGPDAANTVTVTDTLPSGVTLGTASASGGCGESGGVVTCSVGNLGFGGSATVRIAVTPRSAALPALPTPIVNTVTVAAVSPGDLHPENNGAMTRTTVYPPVDLSLTKTDTPDPVAAGGTLTYTLTVTNHGPVEARDVTVTDPLPPGVDFIPPATGCSYTSSDQTVRCSLSILANGARATFTIMVAVRPTTSGVISNTASVAGLGPDANPADNAPTQPTSVTTDADLAITKTDSPDPVYLATNLNYSITVVNNGPVTATNVMVTDNLPPTVSGQSWGFDRWRSAHPQRCDYSPDPMSHLGGTLTCIILDIAPSGNVVIALQVRPTVAGYTLTNTARVMGHESDPNPANNVATAATAVVPARVDLSLTKTSSVGKGVSGPGARIPITYTITVTNLGPSDATGVTVTDSLPRGLTFGSASFRSPLTAGSCRYSPPSVSGPIFPTVTCSIGNLAYRGRAQVTIMGTIPSLTTTITNTASVRANEMDPNLANNSGTSP